MDSSIPKDILIRTKKLCFSYNNSISDCHNILLNISYVLPKVVSDVFGNQIQTLQELKENLVGKVLGIFHGSLITGIVFLLLFGMVVLCL
jgi:hypothetical protein